MYLFFPFIPKRRTLSCRRATAKPGSSSAEEVVDNSECIAHGLEQPENSGAAATSPVRSGPGASGRSASSPAATAGTRPCSAARWPAATRTGRREVPATSTSDRPCARSATMSAARVFGAWSPGLRWVPIRLSSVLYLYSHTLLIPQCNAPCGRQGIKYRILQCVWYGSRRPAGNVCKHQPRPAVMKICKSPSCQAKSEYRGSHNSSIRM